MSDAPDIPQTEAEQPLMELVPRTGLVGVNFRELWAYRGLVLIFAGRDVKVRYKQTLMAWSGMGGDSAADDDDRVHRAVSHADGQGT